MRPLVEGGTGKAGVITGATDQARVLQKGMHQLSRARRAGATMGAGVGTQWMSFCVQVGDSQDLETKKGLCDLVIPLPSYTSEEGKRIQRNQLALIN